MVTQQLIEYIRTQLARGVTKDTLSGTLLQSGYQMNDIAEGFRVATQPQSISTAPPLATTEPITASQKHGRKALLFILMLFFVLLLVGGGGYGYYLYVYNAPDKVVARMVKKMESVSTMVYSFETSVQARTEELDLPRFPSMNPNEEGLDTQRGSEPRRPLGPIEGTLVLKVNGAADFYDIKNSRGYYGADIKVDVRASGLNFGANVALESVYLGDDVYIQVTQFPGMGFLDPNIFVNQWVRINAKELAKLNPQLDVEKKGEALSVDAEEKIKALIRNPILFTITQTLPSEKIANVDTYHYAFTINKEQLRKSIEEIYIILQREHFVTEDAQAFGRDLEEFFAALTFEQGEMWIGKRDNYLYKVTLGASIVNSQDVPVTGALSLAVTLKDHNKPVEVTAPAQYKKLEELLGPLIGSYPITFPQKNEGQPRSPLISPYDRGVLGAQASSSAYQRILEEIFRFGN